MVARVGYGAGHRCLLPCQSWTFTHGWAVLRVLALSRPHMSLFFKQRLQRGLFQTVFFRPRQAAWITCSPCASLCCCSLRRCTALSWALPASCWDADAGFGVSTQRCSAEAFRGTTAASAMQFSTCAKAAMLLNSPCPYCFWHQKHWLQTSRRYAWGKKMKHHGPKY